MADPTKPKSSPIPMDWQDPAFSPLPPEVTAVNVAPGGPIVQTPEFVEFLDTRRKQIQAALLDQMGLR